MEGVDPRRFGSRQLLALRRAADNPPSAHDHSAERLLLLVGWGIMSAATARWLAEGICLDYVDDTKAQTKQFAKIGCSGVYSGNLRRDPLSKFCSKMTVPKPCTKVVPMKVKKITNGG